MLIVDADTLQKAAKYNELSKLSKQIPKCVIVCVCVITLDDLQHSRRGLLCVWMNHCIHMILQMQIILEQIIQAKEGIKHGFL